MIIWPINLILTTSAASRLSDSSDRGIFLVSMIPAVAYILAALALWMVANRRAIKNRQVSLQLVMILLGVLSPGMILLRFVYWSHWWP